MLVLGGTWSYYPVDYQEEFIRDTYYAANTLDSANETLRGKGTLAEEQAENENARYKIIGITLETRPDFITKPELRRFRKYGCTRVQVGLQHTDDSVLLKINRECTNDQGKKAIKLLKECCFKVDVHLMPDLPGSNPEMDRKMLGDALFDPDLDADYYKACSPLPHAPAGPSLHMPGPFPHCTFVACCSVRKSLRFSAHEGMLRRAQIYPTSVTPYTKIEEWYRAGLYKPYADEDGGEQLVEVLIWFKERIQVRAKPELERIEGRDAFALPSELGRELMLRAAGAQEWKRINRIPRDIPNQSIIAGNSRTNLRQILLDRMAKRGLRCKCIRCREVKDNMVDLGSAMLKEREHEASGVHAYIHACVSRGTMTSLEIVPGTRRLSSATY